MLMLQYSFALPADYDMRTVRARVAARSDRFDALPGLGWKAFLVREAGVAGADDNRYAPLYLWPDAAAGADFLLGPLFAGVCDAFGWARVEHGLLTRHQLLDETRTPRWCSIERRAVHGGVDPETVLAEWARPAGEGLHSVWIGLDPSRWLFTRYQLWADATAPTLPAADATLFEVAHFSQPALRR
jgi:hypothetical protein